METQHGRTTRPRNETSDLQCTVLNSFAQASGGYPPSNLRSPPWLILSRLGQHRSMRSVDAAMSRDPQPRRLVSGGVSNLCPHRMRCSAGAYAKPHCFLVPIEAGAGSALA